MFHNLHFLYFEMSKESWHDMNNNKQEIICIPKHERREWKSETQKLFCFSKPYSDDESICPHKKMCFKRYVFYYAMTFSWVITHVKMKLITSV